MLDTFKSWEKIQPLLLNEEMLVESINYLNNTSINSLEDLRHVLVPNIYLYETEEKSFKIETTRQIIEKANIKSSFEFNIFIIREIDKLTLQASNSLLKLLEDVPDWVIFLLTTFAKENLLETIRSRIIEFWFNELNFDIWDNIKDMIWWLFEKDKMPFVKYLLNEKIENHTYIWIMEYMLEIIKRKDISNPNLSKMIIEWISNTYSTNSNPKYILDRIVMDID